MKDQKYVKFNNSEAHDNSKPHIVSLALGVDRCTNFSPELQRAQKLYKKLKVNKIYHGRASRRQQEIEFE